MDLQDGFDTGLAFDSQHSPESAPFDVLVADEVIVWLV